MTVCCRVAKMSCYHSNHTNGSLGLIRHYNILLSPCLCDNFVMLGKNKWAKHLTWPEYSNALCYHSNQIIAVFSFSNIVFKWNHRSVFVQIKAISGQIYQFENSLLFLPFWKHFAKTYFFVPVSMATHFKVGIHHAGRIGFWYPG